MLDQCLPQGRRQRLGRRHGVPQFQVFARVQSLFLCFLQQAQQEAGRADEAGGAEVASHLELQFGRTGSAGDDRRAQAREGSVEQIARGHQMIGQAVEDDLPGREADLAQHLHGGVPGGVVRLRAGFVERSGGEEEMADGRGRRGQHAAKGRIGRLQGDSLILGEDRDAGQVVNGPDFIRLDTGRVQSLLKGR